MGRAYQNRKESMAKTSDAKAKVYSKYGRVIYVCAKEGGTDTDGNLALRGLIERAKKARCRPTSSKKPSKKPKVVAVKISPWRVMKVTVPVAAWSSSTVSPTTRTAPSVMCASVLPKLKCKIGTEGSVSHDV